MEREGVHFACGDFREGQLPAARHGDVGDLLVLDDTVYGQSLIRRHERLLFTTDIVAGEERFDDGGACGGRSDTRIFHRLALGLVRQAATSSLHCVQQGTLRVYGPRLGLLALHVATLYRQCVALMQCGQSRRRIVRPHLRLPPDFAPAALSDHRTFGDELHAAAFQTGGRYVFDADPAEGFDHTACNQVVNSLLLRRQAHRCYLRDEQGW